MRIIRFKIAAHVAQFSVLACLSLFMMVCLDAQAVPKAPKAPTLNAAIVKSLGFSGVKFSKEDNASWTLKNGVTVYSSFPYAQKVRGYVGAVPLFIAVDKQRKIVAIAAAPNQETPEYFNLTKKMLQSWNGKTLKEAKNFTPDAVTGATFSSKAIIQNVQLTAKNVSK